MANPQKENGYTVIANEILEHLSYAGINGSGYRILLVVIRKTYGFHKKKDYISLTQFQKSTHMNRSQAVETIKELVCKRILVKENSVYKLNKNWEEWVVSKRIPVVHESILPSMQKHTKTSMQKHTHKRKKETNTKEITISGQAPKDIESVIVAFKDVNPSYKKWFAIPTQRSACSRLLETHGLELVLKVIALLPQSNKMPYVPTITTPLQLEDKWAQLSASLTKKKIELLTKNKVAFQ